MVRKIEHDFVKELRNFKSKHAHYKLKDVSKAGNFEGVASAYGVCSIKNKEL